MWTADLYFIAVCHFAIELVLLRLRLWLRLLGILCKGWKSYSLVEN
jgi:hypothetical protein